MPGEGDDKKPLPCLTSQKQRDERQPKAEYNSRSGNMSDSNSRTNTTNDVCTKKSATKLGVGPSSETQRKRRNTRFEEALLKWQEYGNDIIERKPPNYLAQSKATRKGTRIPAAAGKGFEGSHGKDEADGVSDERRRSEHQEEVKKLAGRLSEDLKDFQDMQKRSAKIESDLQRLKEHARNYTKRF